MKDSLRALRTPATVVAWLLSSPGLALALPGSGAAAAGGQSDAPNLSSEPGGVGADSAPEAPAASREPRQVSAFAGLEWRVTGQAGHVGHGPGFRAGVLLWQRLQIGLAGHARPGPINPQTFEATPADGQTYKGQSTVELRSDGAFIGLMLAPVFPVLERKLWLELPVTLGQGAYGFYLTGEDRETPDGRKVSEWEDELLDGRDSSIAFGVDAGVRIAWQLGSWVRLCAGAHYTKLFAYDAYVKSSYDGPSGVVGLELGGFD